MVGGDGGWSENMSWPMTVGGVVAREGRRGWCKSGVAKWVERVCCTHVCNRLPSDLWVCGACKSAVLPEQQPFLHHDDDAKASKKYDAHTHPGAAPPQHHPLLSLPSPLSCANVLCLSLHVKARVHRKQRPPMPCCQLTFDLRRGHERQVHRGHHGHELEAEPYSQACARDHV